VFSVPVSADQFEEDLDPALSGEERTLRFGQDDHMRKFGRLDLRPKLAELFGRDVHFSASVQFQPAEMVLAGVPASVLGPSINSHTVFVCRA
jgi:hypothetical protein